MSDTKSGSSGANRKTLLHYVVCERLIEIVSRNEANTAYRPTVVTAYTSDGYLRDAYR